ncbi:MULTISPECIES: hypothetical protein [Bacillus cereus group]|nr:MULTISPECIES: hypothetical protein [Bacillus cereus group]MCU4957523.1 hypothetical protein [Bacillus cereus]MED3180873.1 hypothetical protein [Bacillus thuringiensis]
MKKLYFKEIQLEELNSTPLWAKQAMAVGAGVGIGVGTLIIVT